MILLIDNYDSFSYNLYQLVGEFTEDIKVIRNDAMTIDEIKKIAPSHIILSPGPGRPENAGIIIDVVKNLGGTIPILGAPDKVPAGSTASIADSASKSARISPRTTEPMCITCENLSMM